MRWTHKEKQFLDDNRNVLTSFELAKELPGRTPGAVARAISIFGLRRDPKVLSRMRGPSGKNSTHWKGGLAAVWARYRANHREELILSGIRYRARNPEKFYARIAVYYATKTGKLRKQPCNVCNSVKNIDAHHDDYNEPLKVRWLCRLHHIRLHAERRRYA